MKRRLFNVSRPCYDKILRCPGWNGGGIRWPEVDQCEGGHLAIDLEDRWWKWKFQRCDTCSVRVLPYVTRGGDPGWWKWQITRIPRRIENWRYDQWDRKNRRDYS